MRAAGEVDDAAMLLEQREVAPIEDAMRLARERKQADERIGEAQQGRELGKGLYAGQRFRPAAVARDIEAERDELLRRIRAELAQAEDADRAIRGEVLLAPAPLALGLLRAVAVVMPVPVEHMRENRLGHGRHHAGVDQACDRDALRQAGI